MGFYLAAFRKGLNDAHVGCDMSIMGTGIYGATPRWTRIGAIIVVCFWYDALAADQLPRQIVGGWCLTSERPGKTYAYRRCKNGNYDISVRWDGFDMRRPVANSIRSSVKARPG